MTGRDPYQHGDGEPIPNPAVTVRVQLPIDDPNMPNAYVAWRVERRPGSRTAHIVATIQHRGFVAATDYWSGLENVPGWVPRPDLGRILDGIDGLRAELAPDTREPGDH